MGATTAAEETNMETNSNGTRREIEASAGPEHKGHPPGSVRAKATPSTGVLVERVKRTLRGVPPQRARAIMTLVLAELDEGASGEDVPR